MNYTSYKNGNYSVTIFSDGTKIRCSDNPKPDYPESIDIKITNKCDGDCSYCHESSTPDGKKFNVKKAIELFNQVPIPIELAIGGGNPLTCEQDIIHWYFKNHDYESHSGAHHYFNMTVNAKHIKRMSERLHFINALGISYDSKYHKDIVEFRDKTLIDKEKIIIHMIAGLHTMEDVKRVKKDFNKVLVLGYKFRGRGKNANPTTVLSKLLTWKDKYWDFGGYNHIIAYDNLAVEQLDLAKRINPKVWEQTYMGRDGEFSMYLDLVENKFAASSTSETQYDIGSKTIKEMFKEVRNEKR